MPKALVIFDLDNTLVKAKPAAKEGYKKAIFHTAEVTKRRGEGEKWYAQWKRIIQPLKHELDPVHRSLAYSLGKLFSAMGVDEHYVSGALGVFEKEMLEKLEVVEGARDVLEWCREHGVIVAVATESGKSEAKRKLKKMGLWEYVTELVASNDVGVMKPHEDYFRPIVARAKVGASRVLVVSDEQKRDLDVAGRLGYQTYLVTRNAAHLGGVRQWLEEKWG